MAHKHSLDIRTIVQESGGLAQEGRPPNDEILVLGIRMYFGNVSSFRPVWPTFAAV